MLNSQFTKYKQFNPEKKRLKRFQCENIEEQPDAPWLTLPDEIGCMILFYCSLESFCNIKRVCKQLNKLADRRAEKYAFENTLSGCESQERKDLLDWWPYILKLRAYSFNDPTLIAEYMDFKVDTKQIVEFCMIENLSDIHLKLGYIKEQFIRKPRRELESIIAFDADAILQYFVEVFEEEFKDKPSKWALMTDTKIQNFLWCLLVAFEEYLDQFSKKKQFTSMNLMPVFMNIMSKYSPVVVRLLLTPELFLGRKGFPLLKTMPYRVLRGLAEHKQRFPLDLTSTLTSQDNILEAPSSFYFPPLLLSCFVCDQSMFNEMTKHTPIVPSGYFAALARSTNNSEDRFPFFDGLVEKKIDINAKIPLVIKSLKNPWIETVLGIACFDYNKNDGAILIEWLLHHGARFSENELKALNGPKSNLRASIKGVLEVVQSGKNYNPLKNLIEWNPKQSENYRQLGAVASLTFQGGDKFSVKLQNTTFTGKWQRGRKPNHIICTADKEVTEIVLFGSYNDTNEPIIAPSSRIFDFFAYM